jgi:hypothetical protein
MGANNPLARADGAAAMPADPKAQFAADIAELRARLSAVTAATSDASNVIISGLEDVIADRHAATQDRALDALSACVFHDIVGQHIARAAELLAVIEKLGPPTDADSEAPVRPAERNLVNGPALGPMDGLDQTSVDDFFK